MPYFEDDKIEKISHHIESLSEEMHQVKKAVLKEKEIKEKLAKKDKKRRNSLSKAQKKFKNISTNFKIEEYAKIQKRLDDLKLNSSAYIKKLIAHDLEKKLLE